MFIVWEFYANFLDAMDKQAMVRGVHVPFGPSYINAFYRVKDVGQREYEDYLENMDHDDIIQTLNMEATKWDIANRRHKSFDSKYLTKISHVW